MTIPRNAVEHDRRFLRGDAHRAIQVHVDSAIANDHIPATKWRSPSVENTIVSTRSAAGSARE